MFELGLKLLLSYLLGSVSGALVVGRFRGVDIRNEGSGNAGATNALRTHGFWFAFLVMLIDVGKGAAAVYFFAPLTGFDAPLLDLRWSAAFCGIAAVIGHIFPFWFDFKGGKGGATAIGALLVMSLPAVAAVLVAWIVMLVATGYVGLSTMCAAAAALGYSLVYRPQGPDYPLIFFAAAITFLIIFAHRSNIVRMCLGVESRMPAAMFWRRRPQQ